jgi:hypothetical protein
MIADRKIVNINSEAINKFGKKDYELIDFEDDKV